MRDTTKPDLAALAPKSPGVSRNVDDRFERTQPGIGKQVQCLPDAIADIGVPGDGTLVALDLAGETFRANTVVDEEPVDLLGRKCAITQNTAEIATMPARLKTDRTDSSRNALMIAVSQIHILRP